MSIDVSGNNGSHNEISTKEKILSHAVNLFAIKGFTETTIRELADAVGLKGGSIYSHFSSKNAILEDILEDYSVFNSGTFDKDMALAKLRENATVEGIIDCLHLSFPEGKMEYYMKVLCVMLQEQHRNPMIHNFVSSQIILRSEHDIRAVFQLLKELKVIREDIDFDPWIKVHSSLLYAFSSRTMLGIGDSSPDFSGMGMIDLLRFMFNLLLTTCAHKGSGE